MEKYKNTINIQKYQKHTKNRYRNSVNIQKQNISKNTKIYAPENIYI